MFFFLPRPPPSDMIAQASPSFTVQPKSRSNGDLVWDGAPNAIQCTYFRPGRDMDYWLLISHLSCGIGTRARQRDSSSCPKIPNGLARQCQWRQLWPRDFKLAYPPSLLGCPRPHLLRLWERCLPRLKLNFTVDDEHLEKMSWSPTLMVVCTSRDDLKDAFVRHCVISTTAELFFFFWPRVLF